MVHLDSLGGATVLVTDFAGLLKVPPQFDFLPISFQIHFAKIQTYLVSTTICYLGCETYVCSFVKPSDKLLNYLIFYPKFIEVNIETLKTHEFRPW